MIESIRMETTTILLLWGKCYRIILLWGLWELLTINLFYDIFLMTNNYKTVIKGGVMCLKSFQKKKKKSLKSN